MPGIDKKYIKLSVDGLAVVTLVVALSVGLTRGKSDKNPAANGKSGKSGSGGYYGGKRGKSGGRKLVAPGTEVYMLDEEEAGEATEGQRHKLRHELIRELQTNETVSRSGKAAKSVSSSTKSGKSGSNGNSGKSGKSGSRGNGTYCEPAIRDICDICDTNFTYSGKGGKSGGGSSSVKSSKSGGRSDSGKSGKNGGRLVNGTRSPANSGYYYSGKGGKISSYGRIVNGTCDCSVGSGKSGKSGSVGGSGKYGSYNMNMTGMNLTYSGKSGKSGSYGGSGKSDKSGGDGPGDRCSCDRAPTVYEPECKCETQPFVYSAAFLTCSRALHHWRRVLRGRGRRGQGMRPDRGLRLRLRQPPVV